MPPVNLLAFPTALAIIAFVCIAPPARAQSSPPDPLAALRALAPLHGAPAAIHDSPGTIAFTGTPAVAHAAWVVTPDAAPRRVANFPSGVRVLAIEQPPSAVYVLVETVAGFGQPAGVRSAVWFALG